MASPFRTARSLICIGSLALSASAAFAGDVHRVVVTRVPPIYPEIAHRMHVGGKVVLLVEIQPDGTVSDTKVESGHALLAPAAQDAVRKWKFAPNPSASESEIEINFTIQ
ncbi:MAG TPA: energy transducer TonB [Edaphobacter sp.]|nr:energy transducer TonB [Edaphobacter sp.]